jgi:hypothetical protein
LEDTFGEVNSITFLNEILQRQYPALIDTWMVVVVVVPWELEVTAMKQYVSRFITHMH